MARVAVTPNLQRHVACPPCEAPGATVRAVLDAAFAANPRARGFGSTIGSLWVSDDQGDSWQCVSQHLPPVYCVRFAA